MRTRVVLMALAGPLGAVGAVPGARDAKAVPGSVSCRARRCPIGDVERAAAGFRDLAQGNQAELASVDIWPTQFRLYTNGRADAAGQLADWRRLTAEAGSVGWDAYHLVVARLAELALWIGERRWVHVLRSALRPYDDRLAAGSGASVHLPIPDILGRLALLDGDTDAAIGHLHNAVDLAAAMPSPILLAHCANHLAEAHRTRGDTAAANTIAAIGEAAAQRPALACLGGHCAR